MSITSLREADISHPAELPANAQAEQALLGAILLENRAYQRIADFLKPEHFSYPVHGRIFAACATLIGRGDAANPVTLINLFDQDGALGQLGGGRYLAQLANSAVTIINAEHYGRTILDLHSRRQLMLIAEELHADAASVRIERSGSVTAGEFAHRLNEVRAQGPAMRRNFITASSRAVLPPPVRPWLIEHWIPRRQVTLIGGTGGSGKTLLALQLMVGAASTGGWLGLPVMRCRAYGLFAEDEDDEIDLRLRDLADLSDLDDLAWRSEVINPCELVDIGLDGQIRATEYFDQLRQDVIAFGARLLVLDAAANLFGGDELRRRHVAFLIHVLRGLAVEIDGAVVLLAHPSNHGINNSTGISGSTAWTNSVRSLLVFERPAKAENGEEANENERTLRREKANYARRGEVIRMRWSDGVFVERDQPGSLDRAAMSAQADRVFKGLVLQTYAVGTWTSPNPAARNYAPSIFSKLPDREDLGKTALETAMYRLLKTGAIATESYGPPSKRAIRLATA